MLRHGWFSKEAAERGDVVQLYANYHTGNPVRITWVTSTDRVPEGIGSDLEYKGPIGAYLKTCHGSEGSR